LPERALRQSLRKDDDLSSSAESQAPGRGRRAPPRLRLRGSDRALLVLMTRLWPNLLSATQVVQPETILRWHRAGFKAFWRWKSGNGAGRPKVDRGLRDLIRRMSREVCDVDNGHMC
jgi:hypothetical protein